MHAASQPSSEAFQSARRGAARLAAISSLLPWAIAGLAFSGYAAPARGARHDWLQFSTRGSARSGLAAGNLSALKRQQVRIPGTVDAAVIYLHGVHIKGARHDAFFATTIYGKTLAIDAATGKTLWVYTPKHYSRWAGTRQITNTTPAADPDRRYIYAAAPDGKIRKLAVANGRELWSTAVTRLPHREKIASSLKYFRGHIIAVTSGYIGDRAPYQGHVAIIAAGNGKLLHVWNSLCSNRAGLLNPSSCAQSGSAIWGRAGATIDQRTGDLFVATGNARWDGRRNWGDAVLWLNPSATRLLGNYTPADTAHLNSHDLDIGSSSPALLGGGWIAQGGKDGYIRLLSLRQMRGATPHKGGAVQKVHTPGSRMLFSALAVMHQGGATWLFAADNGGTQAWIFTHGRLASRWQNSHAGTSPTLAGGLLYIYDPHGGLRIYQPESGRQVAKLACGRGHWNSPIIADGRIALPEGNANAHQQSGILDIWRK